MKNEKDSKKNSSFNIKMLSFLIWIATLIPGISAIITSFQFFNTSQLFIVYIFAAFLLLEYVVSFIYCVRLLNSHQKTYEQIKNFAHDSTLNFQENEK